MKKIILTVAIFAAINVAFAQELKPTAAEIKQSISASYDSVHLIKELKASGTLNAEENATLARNKEHLTIMLAKKWFYDALSSAQKTELKNSSL